MVKPSKVKSVMASRKVPCAGGASLIVSFTTHQVYFIFWMSFHFRNSSGSLDIAISICSIYESRNQLEITIKLVVEKSISVERVQLKNYGNQKITIVMLKRISKWRYGWAFAIKTQEICYTFYTLSKRINLHFRTKYSLFWSKSIFRSLLN